MIHTFPYPTKLSTSLTKWVEKIIAKCERLPLTLEMIGRYLSTKDSESICSQCLHALDEAKNIVNFRQKLWSKLQVSYDRLNIEEQEMFLDATCFDCDFHDQDKKYNRPQKSKYVSFQRSAMIVTIRTLRRNT